MNKKDITYHEKCIELINTIQIKNKELTQLLGVSRQTIYHRKNKIKNSFFTKNDFDIILNYKKELIKFLKIC